MPVLRTLDEVWEAGAHDALSHPPMSQEKADRVAAILAPWRREQLRKALEAGELGEP